MGNMETQGAAHDRAAAAAANTTANRADRGDHRYPVGITYFHWSRALAEVHKLWSQPLRWQTTISIDEAYMRMDAIFSNSVNCIQHAREFLGVDEDCNPVNPPLDPPLCRFPDSAVDRFIEHLRRLHHPSTGIVYLHERTTITAELVSLDVPKVLAQLVGAYCNRFTPNEIHREQYVQGRTHSGFGRH